MLSEFNADMKHRVGKENETANALFRNRQEVSEVVEEVKVCVLSSLVLRSREQLIKEQKDDSRFGSLCTLCSYFEKPDEII